MSGKKILVVFEATGNQGGSVIKSVLSDPTASSEFKIRGITRDPSKPVAQALSAKGVECVIGGVNDRQSLKKALADAHSVYAVTNYWEKMDDKLEIEQGKNIANVCKVPPLPTSFSHKLPDPVGAIMLTNGKFPNVHHFDSKAHVEAYVRSIGIPASFFMPGFYMSNIESMMRRSPQPPHAYTLALPMPPTTPIPFFDAADDTGKFVKAMIMKREQVLGKQIFAATDYYMVQKMPETFARVKPKAGKGAQFLSVHKDTYKGFLAEAGMPDPAQEELYENMAFMNEFGYYEKQSLEKSHAILDEKPTTLAAFMAKAPE